ncbi:chorismate-binding protein [Kitasatospora sp. NA04385]|nr:chorismate-binding protein [Kitasatospora sp. NA04385]
MTPTPAGTARPRPGGVRPRARSPAPSRSGAKRPGEELLPRWRPDPAGAARPRPGPPRSGPCTGPPRCEAVRHRSRSAGSAPVPARRGPPPSPPFCGGSCAGPLRREAARVGFVGKSVCRWPVAAGHAFVVDAVRAVLAPFCAELAVPERPTLLRTAAMWHLSSTVTGVLRELSTSALELALALHPTPAVCGTPTAQARTPGRSGRTRSACVTRSRTASTPRSPPPARPAIGVPIRSDASAPASSPRSEWTEPRARRRRTSRTSPRTWASPPPASRKTKTPSRAPSGGSP